MESALEFFDISEGVHNNPIVVWEDFYPEEKYTIEHEIILRVKYFDTQVYSVIAEHAVHVNQNGTELYFFFPSAYNAKLKDKIKWNIKTKPPREVIGNIILKAMERTKTAFEKEADSYKFEKLKWEEPNTTVIANAVNGMEFR